MNFTSQRYLNSDKRVVFFIGHGLQVARNPAIGICVFASSETIRPVCQDIFRLMSGRGNSGS